MRMRRALRSVVLGLGVALLGVLTTSLPRVSEIEEDFELRWLFHLRGTVQAPSEVVVVAIDEQSAQALNLPSKPSEWPRRLHAELVSGLVRAGARLVCFDLTFDAASRAPENDLAFAAAMNEAANVVLVDSLRKEAVGPAGGSKPAAGEIQIERLHPPIPILEEAALAHAAFPLPKEARVDTYWTFKSGAGDSPTLPVVAFQIYAFEAYRDFLALLRRADPSLTLNAPASAKDLVASADGGGLVTKLRNAFLRDPQLAQRVLGELGRAGDPEMTPRNKRLIRSLIDLYRSSEVSYVNFYGPPRSIATLPYHEVLPKDPRLVSRDDYDFRGKAVFVGFSASSQAEQDRIRDDYRTVFSQSSGLDISGVEIAATAFANLLDDRPVRPLSLPWHLALVAFWGVALGVACMTLRPGAATVVVLSLGSAYLFVAGREFGASGVWLPLLVPLGVQAPLALFGGALLKYRDARNERSRIKEAFGRFVPEKIVDRLVERVGRSDSADELVYGACLATDVEKYTTLAETMSPRALADLMNEYFAALFKPVVRLGGVVNEVVGDAMLAIWAAPSDLTSARRQACKAALEIFEALEQFNRARVGKAPLATRFGLHSGELLIGSIGASSHYEYQAVGDMVNTASRIEGLSKYLGTWILASEATVEGLQEFLIRPVGSFLFAGKSASVAVAELGGYVQTANPRTVKLYELFALALECYRCGRWLEAERRFSEIVAAFPEDGPSRFYLRRCEACVRTPPGKEWSPTVRLEHK
jgi:adenylate cyclase